MRIELVHLLYPVMLCAVVGSASLSVGGCGQSGSLYLPEVDEGEQSTTRSTMPTPDANGKSGNMVDEAGTPSADQATEPPQTTGD